MKKITVIDRFAELYAESQKDRCPYIQDAYREGFTQCRRILLSWFDKTKGKDPAESILLMRESVLHLGENEVK